MFALLIAALGGLAVAQDACTVQPDPSAMPIPPDHASADAPPWHAQSALPALVPGACLSRALLQRFGAAMRAHDLSIQLQRMRYDRLYAHERLCRAHGLGDPALRALALHLFDLYNTWPESP